MDKTLDYYNSHAEEYVSTTADVDFTSVQRKFIALLPQSARILDLGCGSGRDTRYFLWRGFKVDAVDGSSELCRLAEKVTGIPVRQQRFQELDEHEKYDGVWACASLLHLKKSELPDVFARINRAMKPSGVFYCSFKYSEFEGFRNGRYFTDFTEASVTQLWKNIPELKLLELWITGDVRKGRESEKWLNLILKKS